MRIAIAVSEYHRGGGFPRYGAQIATGLRSLGHEITVIAQRAEFDVRDEGIRHVPYRLPARRTLSTLIWEPWVLTKLLRAAANEYDVVICVGMACLAPVVLFGTGTHRAYYDVATDPASGGSWLRRLVERVRPFHLIVLTWEWLMLRRMHPSLIVVPDERRAREYEDRFAFPRERIALIPAGVEVGEFGFDPDRRQRARSALGVGSDEKLLVHIGNRGRQKGIDTLMAALERLETPTPWRCVLAGSGSETSWVKIVTRKLVESGKVRLLGRVEDTLDLYCAADLLVFPSRFDPWGLVVTEALAAGLPVIASAGIGASAAVQPGVNGWLLEDSADTAGLTMVIRRALDEIDAFTREDVAATVQPFSHFTLARQLEERLRQVAAG